MAIKEQFYKHIQHLQDSIIAALTSIDGKAVFSEDKWSRPEGGGGKTCILENGGVFEKAGVNTSAVHGKLPESMQHLFQVQEVDFFACGLSLVLHPENPLAPTVHANWRYFELYEPNGTLTDSWFGGGQDLTPCYLFEEDAIHFHIICKEVCDTVAPSCYPDFKKKCDAYFWNHHRNEARGIGGIFFDYCKPAPGMSIEKWLQFVILSGNRFLDSYRPIILRRKDLPYNEQQRTWQEIRRGRYVEFNLIHDKGTLFGLKTNGRVESILMSLPPRVQWAYNYVPRAGSEEEKLIHVLKSPREWV